MMMHAEERGEAQRVGLDDGSWGWQMMTGPNGQPAGAEADARGSSRLSSGFETEGHPAQDDE